MSDRSESISGHGLASPQSTVTVTFDYTGDAQSWTVPTGVTAATFVVNGAAGGLDFQNTTGLGGHPCRGGAGQPRVLCSLIFFVQLLGAPG
jgi:hypothetical protein